MTLVITFDTPVSNARAAADGVVVTTSTGIGADRGRRCGGGHG